MKQKMVRLIFERKIYMDEPMDNSANEIYLEHVRDLSAAFAIAGTLEAAERKLAIKTLWRAGGRGGEAACVAYSGIKWNETSPPLRKILPAGMSITCNINCTV